MTDERSRREEPLRVLVVDDEVDLLLLYRVTLESEGHQVAEAMNGLDALAAAQVGGFNVVLLDMMLPGLDGFGVLAELTSDPRTADLPVVIVSARIGIEDQIRGLESGAIAYLTKPFSIDQLVSLVATIGAMDPEARHELRAEAMARLASSVGDSGHSDSA